MDDFAATTVLGLQETSLEASTCSAEDEPLPPPPGREGHHGPPQGVGAEHSEGRAPSGAGTASAGGADGGCACSDQGPVSGGSQGVVGQGCDWEVKRVDGGDGCASQGGGQGGLEKALGAKKVHLSWLGQSPMDKHQPKKAAAQSPTTSCSTSESGDEEWGEEIDTISELLLDPRKTKSAILNSGKQSKAAASINPLMREALNLIIKSPSPKVSSLIRQHRRLAKRALATKTSTQMPAGSSLPNNGRPAAAQGERTYTYSAAGQRNRWGSAADRAALAAMEFHNQIAGGIGRGTPSKGVMPPKIEGGIWVRDPDDPSGRSWVRRYISEDEVKRAPPEVDAPEEQHAVEAVAQGAAAQAAEGAEGQADGQAEEGQRAEAEGRREVNNASVEHGGMIFGLQDSSREESFLAGDSAEAPRSPVADAPVSQTNLSGLQGNNLSGLQADGTPSPQQTASVPYAKCSPPVDPQGDPYLQIIDFQADGLGLDDEDDVKEEEPAPEVMRNIAEPKVLRFRALEHLDLVESLVDEIEFVLGKVETVEAEHIESGGSPREGIELGKQELRDVQIAVIHDDFQHATARVLQCKKVFEGWNCTEVHDDLDAFQSRMSEAERKAIIQAEELLTLDDDNRKMFEAVRGNDALQKAGFCLADERYDHALAFISRAEGAFLRSGAATDGEDGMLNFLQDMTRRVEASKQSALERSTSLSPQKRSFVMEAGERGSLLNASTLDDASNGAQPEGSATYFGHSSSGQSAAHGQRQGGDHQSRSNKAHIQPTTAHETAGTVLRSGFPSVLDESSSKENQAVSTPGKAQTLLLQENNYSPPEGGYSAPEGVFTGQAHIVSSVAVVADRPLGHWASSWDSPQHASPAREKIISPGFNSAKQEIDAMGGLVSPANMSLSTLHKGFRRPFSGLNY